MTIKVITDTGDFGIGEATPEPLVTGETLEGCEAALKLLADALTGEDPRQLSRIHSIMNQCMKAMGLPKQLSIWLAMIYWEKVQDCLCTSC